MFDSLFGKYRFLVVSIALFLIFDLGVLVLNFYTSGKIAEQAELINLAGRQRTLTQQMSKSTLYIKAQKLQLWVYQSGLDELREHYNTFGATLDVFHQGGSIESTSTGLPVVIQPVESTEGKAILAKANALWLEFDKALAPLMVDTLITDEEIRPASAFIAANNTKLFDIMDELTEFFKDSAERQTTFLRAAQVVGITLATINFFIILFHFLGQLKARDKEIQVKQHESDQILSTIGEGVFLLDENLVMSGQHSKQLEEIFNSKRLSGRRLQVFLSKFFPEKTVKTALDFIKLYFRDHIDPDLIEDVNPLKRIEASITLDTGETQQKYLDFSFAKLNQDGDQETSILVTVRDVTAAILLEAQDQQAADELNQQVELLTQILPIPSRDLESFISESSEGYDRINTLLKDTKHVSDNFNKTLNRIAREMHKLKGNAAAMNLEWVAEQHHLFEDNIDALRERSKAKKLSGRDLLPLTIKLKNSYDNLELITDLRNKLGNYSTASIAENDESFTTAEAANSAKVEQPEVNSKWFGLADFAKRLASEENISIDLNLRGFNQAMDSELSEKLYPMAVQLVRNSIAHGIESSHTRSGLMKPDHGQINMSISHDKQGNYRFSFEDDGRGFDYDGIRQDLLKKGLLNHAQAKAIANTELVRRAFQDSVSTRANVDKLAGRGVGLPLVWQQLKLLGGKLKIRSVEQEFTQFIVDFSHQVGGAGFKKVS